MVLMLFCFFNINRTFSRLKESCAREQDFLATSMIKDLWALKSRGYDVDEAMKISYNNYEEQYSRQGIYLEIYQHNACLYSNLPMRQAFNINRIRSDKQMREVGIITLGQRKYIRIGGFLPEPYNEYVLVYYADVTSMVREWHTNTIYLFIGAIIFSSILSICLAFLLEYLFKPLEKISVASKQIASGKYQEKLEVKGEGEIAEVVENFNIMAHTIREQMQTLEEQMQQIKDYASAKQRLIDNLAHELKTPLTAIYGYAEYIQKTNLDEEKKYISTQFILEESRRLKNVSKILLDMAVLREEKQLEMHPIAMEKLFERLRKIEDIKLREKSIAFHTSCQLREIYGNEDLVEGMLINLLDNAIKACEPLTGKVTLSAYEEAGTKILEVSDNGKGMTKEQISHITEAFYRVDKSRSRSEGGNGLGLTLCEEIIEKHDAKLSFISEPQQGTVVKIVFSK